jgi:hypothetical protein
VFSSFSGPDHLAALLPRCMGQRWYNAGKVGALWGMGHGISATLLGTFAFAVKRTVAGSASFLKPGVNSVVSKASFITEIAVGLSLILIGIMGIKEAKEWQEEHQPALLATATVGATGTITNNNKSLSAAVVDESDYMSLQQSSKVRSSRAVILNGILHGFSWDGAPSLAPSLAVATWASNLTFLSSYAFGTMATMAIVTTLVGEGTRRASQMFQRPDLPQKLSIVSSVLAIGIGVFWCRLAFTP